MKYYLSALVVLYTICKINSEVLEPEPHIIGGSNASLSDVPYIVSLQYTGQHFCGGVLITSCHILTAAHCLVYEATKLQVRINSTRHSTGGLLVKVLTYKRHPKYNGTKFNYDYGMITLAQSVQGIPFAQLPTAENGQPGPNGTQFSIFGWGTTQESGSAASEHLLKVDIPFIDFATCDKTLKSMGFTYLTEECEFCAGEAGKDACSGDSGGPCIRISDKVLIGSTSFGIGCGRSSGGVYAKTVYAIDWIKSIIATYLCPAPAKLAGGESKKPKVDKNP